MGQWVNRSVGQWVTPAHAWVQLGLGAAPSSAPLSVQARAEAGLGDLGASPEELSSLRGFGVPRAVSLVSEHMRSPVALPAQVMVVADCLSSSWLHLAFDPQSWIKQKKKKKRKQTQNPQKEPPNQQKTQIRARSQTSGGGRSKEGTAGSRVPDSLTLFAGHGARLCPPPCRGPPSCLCLLPWLPRDFQGEESNKRGEGRNSRDK